MTASQNFWFVGRDSGEIRSILGHGYEVTLSVQRDIVSASRPEFYCIEDRKLVPRDPPTIIDYRDYLVTLVRVEFPVKISGMIVTDDEEVGLKLVEIRLLNESLKLAFPGLPSPEVVQSGGFTVPFDLDPSQVPAGTLILGPDGEPRKRTPQTLTRT
jgi:hypothetical protein